MWVRLAGKEERDKGIAALKTSGMTGLWVSQDRVLEDRVVGSFMLGLKRQLIEWGFSRREVQVELEKGPAVMKVGGKEVLVTRVVGGKLVLSWEDAGWKEWTDLAESGEYEALLAKAEDTLSKAGAGGKAKGKGRAE